MDCNDEVAKYSSSSVQFSLTPKITRATQPVPKYCLDLRGLALALLATLALAISRNLLLASRHRLNNSSLATSLDRRLGRCFGLLRLADAGTLSSAAGRSGSLRLGRRRGLGLGLGRLGRLVGLGLLGLGFSLGLVLLLRAGKVLLQLVGGGVVVLFSLRGLVSGHLLLVLFVILSIDLLPDLHWWVSMGMYIIG